MLKKVHQQANPTSETTSTQPAPNHKIATNYRRSDHEIVGSQRCAQFSWGLLTHLNHTPLPVCSHALPINGVLTWQIGILAALKAFWAIFRSQTPLIGKDWEFVGGAVWFLCTKPIQENWAHHLETLYREDRLSNFGVLQDAS